MGRLTSVREVLFLKLRALTVEQVRGIYGAEKDRLPKRMRYLHPAAATSFLTLGPVVVSDMFRSAESSLWAIRNRRGAQPPAYSGHNFGRSIDLDVSDSIRALELDGKAALDEYMAERGWYCHRRDHKRAHEDWHFNYGVREFIRDTDRRTSAALERWIQAEYGERLKMGAEEIQTAMGELGLYRGEVDGLLGELSQEATRCFQRAWGLHEDGIAGRKTQRVLAYVTARRLPS